MNTMCIEEQTEVFPELTAPPAPESHLGLAPEVPYKAWCLAARNVATKEG